MDQFAGAGASVSRAQQGRRTGVPARSQRNGGGRLETRRISAFCGFQDRCLQPLGHLSALEIRQVERISGRMYPVSVHLAGAGWMRGLADRMARSFPCRFTRTLFH